MGPNVGEATRARTVLGDVLVFWDKTPEKTPMQDNLNTLHTVSIVNKAQIRNVHM